jgi:hypothetical protein
MKKYERVTVGWRVMSKTMVPDKDGALVESIKPLSRIFHVKEAAQEFYMQALRGGTDCWVAEIQRPERKELEVK